MDTRATRQLYILSFADEPLIKIGISSAVPRRIRDLGGHRFDPARSYVVTSIHDKYIYLLEHHLQVLFSDLCRFPQVPLRSGNNEIFCSSILASLLANIREFDWKDAGFIVTPILEAFPDISVLEPSPSLPPSPYINNEQPHSFRNWKGRAAAPGTPPPAYSSPLWAHLPLIESRLKRGAGWRNIALELTNLSVPISAGALCNFYNRYRKRKAKKKPLPLKLREIVQPVEKTRRLTVKPTVTELPPLEVAT